MKLEHLKYLRCPETKEQLHLVEEKMEDGKVKSGFLIEKKNGVKYPIINFIPRFVKSNNYANSFGLEWNNHKHTQYDEFSGFNISEERFKNETKWDGDMQNEVILEAGCGSGRFTRHVSATDAMIISFDYSNAIDVAYSLNSNLKNCLHIQADIYNMPFENNFFDRVLCIGVLQHTPDPNKAFNFLVEVLKSKGKICTDIYLKNFINIYLTPKYLLRQYTKQMNPEKLYKLVSLYINFMWQFSKIVRKIPKIGKSINWLIMIADYSYLLKNVENEVLKEWAILDTFDMLSPAYDIPQTLKTFKKWHEDAGLLEIDVHYGYNGIEGRGIKP